MSGKALPPPGIPCPDSVLVLCTLEPRNTVRISQASLAHPGLCRVVGGFSGSSQASPGLGAHAELPCGSCVGLAVSRWEGNPGSCFPPPALIPPQPRPGKETGMARGRASVSQARRAAWWFLSAVNISLGGESVGEKQHFIWKQSARDRLDQLLFPAVCCKVLTAQN